MKYGFGVDIGGTTIKIGCFTAEGELFHKWEIPTRTTQNGSHILPDISKSISQYLLEKSIEREWILGVGLGVPGPVIEKGIVNKCVNLGWDWKDICTELSSFIGFPVIAGNDANVAALGECWKGGGKGCDNVVMVTLGTGIGGAIIHKGGIVSGSHGAGGEIGHMLLKQEEKEPCNCGKCGCAEQYCSATGILRIAKHYLSEYTDNSILRQMNSMECKDIFAAAEQGDKLALSILEEVYKYQGLLLANVCCVSDPEMILLGGGVSKAGQPLIDGTKKYFQRYAFHACRTTEIKLAELGNDAGIYGAYKLLLDTLK